MIQFEQLYMQHRRLVFGYLRKLCRNDALAEELEQETFFRAYMNLSSLRQEDKASLWLCRIAQNAYFAWYNEHKRLSPLVEDMGEDPNPDPEQLLCQRECSAAAFGALEALEEPYRQVLTLYILGELSLKEISRSFGKSESWARVTLHRGKQKLKERMRTQYEL